MKTLIAISLLALCASSTIRMNLDINDDASRQFIISNFKKIKDSTVLQKQLDIVFFGHSDSKNLRPNLRKNKDNIYMNSLLIVFSQNRFALSNFFDFTFCVAKGLVESTSSVYDKIVDCDIYSDSIATRVDYVVDESKVRIWSEAALQTHSSIKNFDLPFFSLVAVDLSEDKLKEMNALLKADLIGNYSSFIVDEKRKDFLKLLVDSAKYRIDKRDHREKFSDAMEELVDTINKKNHKPKLKTVLDEMEMVHENKRDHHEKFSDVMEELVNTVSKKNHEQKLKTVLDEMEMIQESKRDHREKFSDAMEELVNTVSKENHEQKLKVVLDEMKMVQENKRDHREKFSDVMEELVNTVSKKSQEQKLKAVLDEMEMVQENKRDHREKFSDVMEELVQENKTRIQQKLYSKLMQELKKVKAVEEISNNETVQNSLKEKLKELEEVKRALIDEFKKEKKTLIALSHESMKNNFKKEELQLLEEITREKEKKILRIERNLILLKEQALRLSELINEQFEEVIHKKSQEKKTKGVLSEFFDTFLDAFIIPESDLQGNDMFQSSLMLGN